MFLLSHMQKAGFLLTRLKCKTYWHLLRLSPNIDCVKTRHVFFQVETPVRKYNNKIPSWLTVYVSVHFLLFLVGYQELMARHGVSRIFRLPLFNATSVKII